TAGSGGAAGGLNLMKAETDIGSTQPPVTYRPVLDSALLDAVIQQVKRAGVFAFDTETDNLDELIASPVGFSISVKGCEAYYIPVRSPNAACIPEKTVKAGLTKILTDPSLRLIGQNIKFDYKVMKRWGIEMANISFDTMIAAWLLDSDASSYSLDTLSEKVLHVTPLHFTDVVKKGESFADVPIQQATAYSAEDADFTYRLYEVYAPRLEERGLSDLFTRIEMPLVRILAEMELTGIRILPEVLIEFGRELEKELFSLESKIYKECGEEFNINSTQQLSHILFDVRKLKAVKKTKTGFSTDINVLEELAREDVVPGLVLRHRALSKLKSTYVDSLPKLINPETGRLHTRFIQTGTATGRLSSRDPNLQNIPIRDEEGRRIRDAFVPAPGFSFLSADYSQIELVVLAHLSGDPGLKEAFLSGKDVHRNTASLLFGVPEEEVTAEERRIAKTINFGVIYGMSAFRLARDLGIPRAEADKFLASYFGRYSGIRSFIERTVKAAEEEGVVRTILKRERTITGINSRNRTEKMSAERIAVNTPIQGSAADIVKLAMIRVTKRLHSEGLRTRLILQVHDELIFEVPSEEESSAEKIVREEMEHAYPLSVPLRVSIEMGKSWGELH
ncbi:MAG TPA: DNA polymerase I, partial [Spirochaetia bacterium]|nr:DNA polymerase I [Spirochaetia bacterium]